MAPSIVDVVMSDNEVDGHQAVASLNCDGAHNLCDLLSSMSLLRRVETSNGPPRTPKRMVLPAPTVNVDKFIDLPLCSETNWCAPKPTRFRHSEGNPKSVVKRQKWRDSRFAVSHKQRLQTEERLARRKKRLRQLRERSLLASTQRLKLSPGKSKGPVTFCQRDALGQVQPLGQESAALLARDNLSQE